MQFRASARAAARRRARASYYMCSCVGHTSSSLPVARCRRSCSRKKALALPFQFFLLSGRFCRRFCRRNTIAAGQPSHAHTAGALIVHVHVRRTYLLFPLLVFDDPIAERKLSLSPFSFFLLPGVSAGVSAGRNPGSQQVGRLTLILYPMLSEPG